MDPPAEQRSKPRKRDRIKRFFKDPLGSRTPSSSLSRTTAHSTVAGGPGTSSQAVQDVAISSPLAENTTRSEIQSNRDNVDTTIGGHLRQDLPSQAIQSTSSEPIPSLPAQNDENALMPSTSAFDHNGGSQVLTAFLPSGRLAESQGEGEAQGTTTHVENPIQDHSVAVVEGDPSDPLPPAQSSIPAAATSHAANKPQESTAHVEHQPAGLASKIYEGVNATLRKSVAAGLLVICETIDAYGENKQEFDELLKRVEVLSRIMDSCPPDVSQEVKDRFDGLLRTLEEKQKMLQEKVNPARSRVERVMLAPQDKQEVLKLTQEIRFAIEIAMFDVIVENRAQTLQIVSGVTWLKERIDVIEDHTGIMRTIERTVQSLKRSNTLLKLGRVEGAEHSNAKRGPGCIPGSRVSLLAMLLVWATDPSSPHLFWLSGLAGTGKTTVSKTLCSQLNDRGLLGASFFCTLKESDKRDVYLIIPTLAKILAEERPKFGDALEAILESDRGCRNPAEMELKDQYSKLILQPAEKTFAANELLVLGVDALDECEDQDAVKLFLAAIVSQRPTIPLKFFLTSRPEISLRESFEASTHHGWLRLHDIEADIVRADILLYLNERFKHIPRVYKHYQADWPPPEIQTILNVSGTLFIIAATMVAYIATYSGNHLKRFQELGRPASNVQLSGIGALYSRILTEAFKELEQEEADMICSCLSLLLTAQKPISVNTYAKLLSTDALAIREAFKSLHSVVQIPDEGCDDAPISIFHASFVDYLTAEKYHGNQWAIDRCTAHCHTAGACFTLMDSGLYFGISGAKTSYRSNDDQPTSLQVEAALAYACTAWGEHVLHAGITQLLQLKIQEFVETEKVLYWLEALSVLKNVSYAHNTLWQISKKLVSTELGPLLNNIGDFVHNFAAPISHSAPHLYLSALPFYAATEQPVHALLNIAESVPIIHHNLAQKQVVSMIPTQQGIWSVAFSPNSKYIVSGLWNGVIQLWSAQTGQAVLEPMTGNSHSVKSVAFSPNGKYIVSGSLDSTVRVWDAQTGKPALQPMTGHGSIIRSVAFSPDGKYIASGSDDKTIRLWDAQTGQPVLEPILGHSDHVSSVAFSPDSKYIVSGSDDKTIRLWDAQTGQPVLEPMTCHSNYVWSVAFSPEGKYIVSGSADNTIRLWDAQTGQPALEPMIDNTIRVWDAQTGQQALEPITGHGEYVTSVAFSSDGRYIASGSADETIRIWDADTGQPALEPMTGHEDHVKSAAFSPDGKYIVSGSADKTIRLWDAQTGQPVFKPMTGHSDYVTSVAFSSDGNHIASGSDDNTIRLWDAQTGEAALEPMVGHSHYVVSVAFSPDGKYVVSGSADKTIRLWHAQTGQPVLEPITGHSDYVTSVMFSPDGKYIVSASDDNTIRLWDGQTGKPALEPMTGHSEYVKSVAFSPDGKYIVSGSEDNTIRLWDAQTGQPALEPIMGHTDYVTCIAFSPDGKYIVSGSDDKTIRLWDAHTGQPASEAMTGHSDCVLSVAFSPESKYIVSGSADKTIRLWDAQREQPALKPTAECNSKLLFLHNFQAGTLTFNNNGWIQNSSGDLLLWVPPYCQTGLHHNHNCLIIGNLQTTKVELTNAVYHGPDWQKCKEAPPSDHQTHQPWPINTVFN
ncbi:hypothetical protein H1R20_g8021, partial [Candolleomyces eurysporus]